MSYDGRTAEERGEQAFDYAVVLRAVADEGTYPNLNRIAWSGQVDDPDGTGEEESFLFGLDCILDGIAARIDARG